MKLLDPKEVVVSKGENIKNLIVQRLLSNFFDKIQFSKLSQKLFINGEFDPGSE